jgi:putative transposase
MDRRTIRLQGFDYGQQGVYYVSICTRQGQPLLGRLCRGRVVATELGLLVERTWRELPVHFPGARLDQFRILPNHLHGIVVIITQPTRGQAEAYGSPTRQSLPTMIRSFKAACTRDWRRQTGRSAEVIWQGRYLERVIRSRRELASLRTFIRDNLLWHRLQDRDSW